MAGNNGAGGGFGKIFDAGSAFVYILFLILIAMIAGGVWFGVRFYRKLKREEEEERRAAEGAADQAQLPDGTTIPASTTRAVDAVETTVLASAAVVVGAIAQAVDAELHPERNPAYCKASAPVCPAHHEGPSERWVPPPAQSQPMPTWQATWHHDARAASDAQGNLAPPPPPGPPPPGA